MEDAYVCNSCGRTIPREESKWTVVVNEEIQDETAITVLDSTWYLIYCRDCQGDYDFPNVSVPRKDPGSAEAI
jgi:NMD protein affecting ribosome stability and mRNA decay